MAGGGGGEGRVTAWEVEPWRSGGEEGVGIGTVGLGRLGGRWDGVAAGLCVGKK